MRWSGRRESDNVEDRRGQDGGLGGGSFGGGLGGGGFRLPIGRGGGIGGIVIVGIFLLGSWLLGVDPSTFFNGDGGSTVSDSGTRGAPGDEGGKFVATVLADTEDTWTKLLPASGVEYRKPTLVLFSGSTSSACGFAQAATGPFYCPEDEKVYIDLDFYRELSQRFQAPGDFAEAYVIAHEVGHHVQNLLGILPKVHEQEAGVSEAEANRLSVRTELQADCLAGIWAHAAEAEGILDVGDIDEALNAAAAVGDDSIQMRTQGHVVPESFNHGTSAQRSRWFKQGYTGGKISACDTFGASQI
jgi:predicted metalloprotease